MAKLLANTYEPQNPPAMTADQIRSALSDFHNLTADCMQIVNKNRTKVPFVLNRMQEQFFNVLLPMIEPESRIDRHKTIVWLKPRQGGGTTGLIAFLNYLCGFSEGMENTTIIHTLPVADTLTKLGTKKVEPIITAIHPDIFPSIEKETMGTSIMYRYKDILSVPRNNYYELVSAGASSIRSDTVHIWIADECGWYKKPEDLEDIVGGAMPDTGFSLTVFISTFGDRNSFFRNKILTALDNPETYEFVFTPWFYVYPEVPEDITLAELEAERPLSDYEKDTIIPAFEKFEYPHKLWAPAIKWYRNKKLTVSNMKQEYPTTLEEILAIGQNKCVFSEDNLTYCDQNAMEPTPYTLMTDNLTKEVKAVASDEPSSFNIYIAPQYGHRYRLVVDPIMSQSDSSDFFALSVFDITQAPYEQVATFRDRDMAIEDYADMVISIAKLYNRGEICPERNIAEALVACIRAQGYYNFYYEDQLARAKKVAGIRTTATSKPNMIDKAILLLNQHNLVIHDKVTIAEMKTFEKKEKHRADGSTSIKLEARKGHHDDACAAGTWLFAGSLNQVQLKATKSSGWSIL